MFRDRFSCYPAFKAQLKFISSLGSLFRMFQAPPLPPQPPCPALPPSLPGREQDVRESCWAGLKSPSRFFLSFPAVSPSS